MAKKRIELVLKRQMELPVTVLKSSLDVEQSSTAAGRVIG